MYRINIIVRSSLYVVLGLVLIYSLLLICGFPIIGKIELEKSGLFGDSFGVLTSLFSGLAFAGLIWTILLQREDLNRQRNEFKKSNFENSLFFFNEKS